MHTLTCVRAPAQIEVRTTFLEFIEYVQIINANKLNKKKILFIKLISVFLKLIFFKGRNRNVSDRE